jgi:hypothetical protein
MRGISWLAAKPFSFSRRTLLHGVRTQKHFALLTFRILLLLLLLSSSSSLWLIASSGCGLTLTDYAWPLRAFSYRQCLTDVVKRQRALTYTGDGQNMETVVKDTHFFINTEFMPPFVCNRVCILLAVDTYTYKFWTISIGIPCHSSWIGKQDLQYEYWVLVSPLLH